MSFAPPPPPVPPPPPPPPGGEGDSSAPPTPNELRELPGDPTAGKPPEDPKLPVTPKDGPKPPGDSTPPKPGELPKEGQVKPPMVLPDLPLPPMQYTLPTEFPQPFYPVEMRRLFSGSPEPQLLRALDTLFFQGLSVNTRDDMGNSMLMLAVATGKPLVVWYLMERFPMLAIRLMNRFGEIAATLAQAYCPDVLPMLLKAGAKLKPENPALAWYLSQSTNTPTDAPRLQQLATMLDQDNYLNLRDETGKTLLFHAVIRGDVDVVRFLCNLMVGPAVVWRDSSGKSLFDYTTEIADGRRGTAICKELRELRRRDRPLYKRTVDRF